MYIKRVRANSMAEWIKSNLNPVEKAAVQQQGASNWPRFAHYSDTEKLWERFGGEIWTKIAEDAKEKGYNNPLALMADLEAADAVDGPKAFHQLLIWYYVDSLLKVDVEIEEEGEPEKDEEEEQPKTEDKYKAKGKSKRPEIKEQATA